MPRSPSDQFMVRFPPGIRDRIAEAARENGRSMNAEIVHRLQRTFAEDDAPRVDLPLPKTALESDPAGFIREAEAIAAEVMKRFEETYGRPFFEAPHHGRAKRRRKP